MEKQINNVKLASSSSIKKLSTLASNKNYYLDQLKYLQAKTKEILNNDSLFPIPEKEYLNKDLLKRYEKKVPVKIPVMVPMSLVEKSRKIQPPSVQRVLKNGEVCNVYILSETTPAYDPLVRAEAILNKKDFEKEQAYFAEITHKDQHRWKSLSPKRKKEEDYDLVKAEYKDIREMTPQMKVQRYNYRDFSYGDTHDTSARNWVGKRMKAYSDIIKSSYKPVVSEKKQIEMQLIKEKIKNSKFCFSNRLKL